MIILALGAAALYAVVTACVLANGPKRVAKKAHVREEGGGGVG